MSNQQLLLNPNLKKGDPRLVLTAGIKLSDFFKRLNTSAEVQMPNCLGKNGEHGLEIGVSYMLTNTTEVGFYVSGYNDTLCKARTSFTGKQKLYSGFYAFASLDYTSELRTGDSLGQDAKVGIGFDSRQSKIKEHFPLLSNEQKKNLPHVNFGLTVDSRMSSFSEVRPYLGFYYQGKP